MDDNLGNPDANQHDEEEELTPEEMETVAAAAGAQHTFGLGSFTNGVHRK